MTGLERWSLRVNFVLGLAAVLALLAGFFAVLLRGGLDPLTLAAWLVAAAFLLLGGTVLVAWYSHSRFRRLRQESDGPVQSSGAVAAPVSEAAPGGPWTYEQAKEVLTLLKETRPGGPATPNVERAVAKVMGPAPDSKWSVLARRIKEDFEEDYTALVMGALVDLRVASVSTSRFAELAELPYWALHAYGTACASFIAEWRRGASFAAFNARAASMPDAMTKADFEELVALYVASLDDYRRLRQHQETRVKGDIALLRHAGASDERLRDAEKPWVDLKTRLDAFETRLGMLDRHLRAQAVGISAVPAGR